MPALSDEPPVLPVKVRRGYLVTFGLVNVLWPLAGAGAAVGALSAGSLDGWWWAVSPALALALLYRLLGLPPRSTVTAPAGLVFAAGLAVALVAVVRPVARRGPVRPRDAGVLVIAAALLGLRGLDARRALRDDTPPLRWPLPEGRWTIGEGEGTLPNHHWPVTAQRGALDVVGRGRDGRSARTLLPTRASDFVAFGAPVVAPCAGEIRAVLDGRPDVAGPPAPGNHVVLVADGGEELLLCHLRRGSVAVAAGERVVAGQPLGQVGNSGNSSEPHLHVHAVRDGRPLRLRFAGVSGPLRRNRAVGARAAARYSRQVAAE